MRLVRARDDKEPKVLPGLMALQKAEGEGGGGGERIFRVFKERDRIRGTVILLVRARETSPKSCRAEDEGREGRRDGGTEGPREGTYGMVMPKIWASLRRARG